MQKKNDGLTSKRDSFQEEKMQINLLVVSRQDAAAQRQLGSQSLPKRTHTHSTANVHVVACDLRVSKALPSF